MPEKETVERARADKRAGKAPSTQAGEFVREEMHHVREGKHGARSTKQAIAIGLSKARRAGVKLKPPGRGAKPKTRRSAASATRAARRHARPSGRRSRAISEALKREGRSAASRKALSRQASSAARRRSAADRSAAARRAARTKGPRERRAAAQKAARTRQRHGTTRRRRASA
ncbi:MAG: DNA-binding protein [Acidobacteria bacterium]|nr:MAG: DNA-binding protein [Acidobacteriota bacterium]